MAGFSLSADALNPILESKEVRDLVDEAASEIAARAGEGYEAQQAPYLGARRRGGGRWRSSVVTATPAAMRDNAKNQTLLKAAD